MIRERTRAGLASAKARSRRGGRPKGISKEALEKQQKALFDRKEKSTAEIARILGIVSAFYFFAHQMVTFY